MEVTADYSFSDFRSPLPVPRFSNIPFFVIEVRRVLKHA